MKCLEAAMLSQLLTQAGPEEVIGQLDAHLSTCRRCARVLADDPGLQALERRVRELHASRMPLSPALFRLHRTEQVLTQTLFGRD